MTLTIFLTLLAGTTIGTFAGLLICANTDLGNFSFTEPGKDILRCVILGLVVAACGAGLITLTRSPRVFFALVPVWFIAAKLCWLDMDKLELGILGASALVFFFVALTVAVKILR